MSGTSDRSFTRHQLIEAVGYAGSTCLLGVYMLMLRGDLSGTGLGFNAGMFFGCALLGLNMAAHRAWPGVVTQSIFCLVAGVALYKILF